MIPAEAVEAAARKLALKTYFKEFLSLDDYTQDFLRVSAKLAIEAAAPFIEQAAYDRGFDDGHRAGQESAEENCCCGSCGL